MVQLNSLNTNSASGISHSLRTVKLVEENFKFSSGLAAN